MALWPTRPVADSDYWLTRALDESHMAEHAASPAAETAHHALASAYLEELFGAAESRVSEASVIDDPQRGRALLLEQVGHRLAAVPALGLTEELTSLLDRIS